MSDWELRGRDTLSSLSAKPLPPLSACSQSCVLISLTSWKFIHFILKCVNASNVGFEKYISSYIVFQIDVSSYISSLTELILLLNQIMEFSGAYRKQTKDLSDRFISLPTSTIVFFFCDRRLSSNRIASLPERVFAALINLKRLWVKLYYIVFKMTLCAKPSFLIRGSVRVYAVAFWHRIAYFICLLVSVVLRNLFLLAEGKLLRKIFLFIWYQL